MFEHIRKLRNVVKCLTLCASAIIELPDARIDETFFAPNRRLIDL